MGKRQKGNKTKDFHLEEKMNSTGANRIGCKSRYLNLHIELLHYMQIQIGLHSTPLLSL